MFPAQTSLVPATVALARFAETHGFSGDYPYWYLGSTPFKYLTGPVVSGILVGLHKLFPEISFFNFSLFLLPTSYFLGSIGWGFLAWKLSGKKRIGVAVGILTFFLPWHWISGLALSELSSVVAAGFVPWVLLGFRVQAPLIPILLFALLLLTNTVSSIPAIIGLILLGIIISKKWEEGIKKALLVIIIGWTLTLWWYTPSYWLTIWTAPSLGGRIAVSAFVWLIDTLRGFIPFILAIFVVLWGARVKDNYQKFALSWFGGFGILTLIRFLSDPDFWMDWTAWIGELEIGIALLTAHWIAGPVTRPIYYLLITILLITVWYIAWQKKDFWLPRRDVSGTVEKRIADFLHETVKPGEIVFLSGTTAFWLNSFYDIRQVRGGVDQAAIHPNWRAATWELREGIDPERSEQWIRELRIKFIVVHTEDSEEFYHDFAVPGKFKEMPTLMRIYGEKGDIIYKF